jgi:GNAT superfamily N-acetyltransferase
VHIRRSALASPDAARLIAALNAELTTTFPEPGATHFSLSDAQVVAGDGAFLVAYLDDLAVGCGAVRRLDETTAEIKRMYVDPSVRSRGIGRTLVEALEHEFLILTHEEAPLDVWNAREGTFKTRCVSIEAFTEHTLHLLQFARSAIFNFTFCARHETRSEGDDPRITLTLQHKYPEPKGKQSRRKGRTTSSVADTKQRHT